MPRVRSSLSALSGTSPPARLPVAASRPSAVLGDVQAGLGIAAALRQSWSQIAVQIQRTRMGEAMTKWLVNCADSERTNKGSKTRNTFSVLAG